jgi:glycerophosphoryl diester phosphodiesterase
MSKKVIVASFDAGALKEIRSVCPEVATSAGASEAFIFYYLQKIRLESVFSPDAQALQVPATHGDRKVVNRRFLEAAHDRNMRVHVWTINDIDSMKRLLKMGVDGIMTDYPDRLLDLLKKQQR